MTMCIFAVAYLFELLCDHGKSSEDCLCGPCDGNYSLWGWSLWYVDASTALEIQIYYTILNLQKNTLSHPTNCMRCHTKDIKVNALPPPSFSSLFPLSAGNYIIVSIIKIRKQHNLPFSHATSPDYSKIDLPSQLCCQLPVNEKISAWANEKSY